jgi:hypothetical protein
MNERDDYCYELISAYVDGELTPDECARVEQLVASSDEYRQALADMRAVGEELQGLPQHHLGDLFADHVIAVARSADMKRGSHRDAVPPASRHRITAQVWHWPAAMGLLTTVAALVIAGFFLVRPGGLLSHADQRVSQVDRSWEGTLADESTSLAPADLPAVPPTPSHGGATVSPPAQDRTAVASTHAPSDAAGQATPAGPPEQSGNAPAVAADPGLVSPSGAEGAATVVSSDAGSTAQRHMAAPGPQPSGEASAAVGAADRVNRSLVDVPFSGAQQLLLVVDIALTQQGLAQGAFERALAAQGIPIEGTVPVDANLETSLLASRFFDPIKAPTNEVAAADTSLSLMYVRTRARQIDELWRAMQADQGGFARITLDMALLPDDMTMFRDLRRAVEVQVAKTLTPGDEETRARRAAAHRLALSPSWRGTPVTKVNGAAGALPDWMLGKSPTQTASENVGASPTPRASAQPGQQLGADMPAELLCVIHIGRIAGDQ